MKPEFILAIDQGTTSSRAILFDRDFNITAHGQKEFPQHFPQSGWVEHDPEDLWKSSIDSCKLAIRQAGIDARQIAAIGITNQRETTVIWDRATGKPVYNAIVWQDRRTSEKCHAMRDSGYEALVGQRTGLLLDPYFSGTKIAWILDNVQGLRQEAESGKLAFGTVDSFLLWRLSGGRTHKTDATNASRTLLYNIYEGCWDKELLALFQLPERILPEVNDSAFCFGHCDPAIFGTSIPICGIAGDQHAATIGQACFQPGMVKSTYGTGCFALLNTGEKAVRSSNRLLTTIAYQFDGKPVYALEGSIFIAGAAVQWLRDGLRLIDSAEKSGILAAQAKETEMVYLVPAFVGMGAPYWDAECRGALFGLTRNTGPAEIARAALEAVCFQTGDLLDAMQSDWAGIGETVLRVDGGMAASDWTMQRLADLLDAPVDRPQIQETTALGAAYLAGLASGFYPDLDAFADRWKCHQRFLPHMAACERKRKRAG